MFLRRSLNLLRNSLPCRSPCSFATGDGTGLMWRNFSAIHITRLGVSSYKRPLIHQEYNLISSKTISIRTLCSDHDSGLRKDPFSPPFSLTVESDKVSIVGRRGQTMKFHYVWLRDHCPCPECLAPVVNQREIDVMEIPLDIKPVDVSLDGDKLVLKWEDDHQTIFDMQWLSQHCYDQLNGYYSGDERKEIYLWDGSISQNIPPPFSYEKIMHNQAEVLRALECILKYGFVFVNGVPTTAKGTEDVVTHLCENVMETFYGRVIVFTSNQEFADTAYSSDAIGGHNDTTYFTESLGLQTFHCHYHDGTGGENLLVDTFRAAETLRCENPEDFQILSTTPITFHYLDNCRHFKALSPIIRLHPLTNTILQVRYNNYDRGPLDTLRHEDIPRFYKALQTFVSIVQKPENELWIKLEPGTMILLDNWRVMHGRSSFSGKRIMCSSYVSRDNFMSKVRFLRSTLET